MGNALSAPSQATDLRRLVGLAQDGDREALEALYLLHFDRIYSYLHLSVGNRHDAEDLTTQTFLKMLEAIGRFRWRSAPFSAWLFRIAHNLAMDHFRASKRWQPEEEVPEPDDTHESSAEEEAFQSIGRKSMLRLIEDLSHERELLVADRDHVERRLERVRSQAKSGDPRLREEVAALERGLAHLEAGRPLSEFAEPLPPELEPLTTKPLVVVVNGAGGSDLKLEAELRDLDEAEAAELREGPSALDSVLRSLFEAADLITFFTAGENETRAWTLRRGGTALDAAASVHTDLARGFIRCEVIRWNELVEAGSHAEAARRGQQRVEGKTYVVEDGDVLNVRFSV